VDVRVTKGGEAVRDLTHEDFEILEDGVAQRITYVSFIQLAGAVRSLGADGDSRLAANEPEGRTVVLMLAVRNERLWEIARLFVEKGIGPGDRVAVVSVLQTATPRLVFTSNREEIIEAVRYITRGTGTARPGGLPPADLRGLSASAAAFRVAENVVGQLGAINGRRKIVVWFSPPASFMTGDPDTAIAQRDALRTAARQNVAIYTVDRRGLTTQLGRSSLEMKAQYRSIADETGGDAITDSNNFASAFERFLRDSSSYYLLTYEPAMEYTDGRFHRIVVRVKGNGLSVRARTGYYAPEVRR